MKDNPFPGLSTGGCVVMLVHSVPVVDICSNSPLAGGVYSSPGQT